MPFGRFMYMNAKALSVLLFCCVQISLFGQRQDSSATENYVRINYDNDFFTATDRYYTQGTSIEYINSFLARSPFSYALIRAGKVNYFGIGITQNIYTPKSIDYDAIFYGERPYASTLHFSSFLVSLNPARKLRLTTQLDLGIIGPATGGGEQQKAIHRALPNNGAPMGWQYQIANDAIVNYNTQIEKGIVNTTYFELVGIGKLRLGTLNDDLSTGLMFRTGLLHPYFKSLGLYKNADTKRKINNFQLYLFAKGTATLVGYDGTMQGGVFNRKSPYTLSAGDVSRVTASVYAGAVFSYLRVSIEFAHVYATPQFKGLYNSWGHCNLTVAF